MAYYLSPKNRQQIIPYINIIKNSVGQIKFDVNDPERLIYLLNSAKREFPELNNWMFKKKETHVLCKPKNVIETSIRAEGNIEPKIQEYKEEIDLVGVAGYVVQMKPTEIKFLNASLSDKDISNLTNLFNKLEYSHTWEPPILTIKKL